MRTKDIDYRLFCWLIIVMVSLMNVILSNALGCLPPCPECEHWVYQNNQWRCVSSCPPSQGCCFGTCYSGNDCKYCEGTIHGLQSYCDLNWYCCGNGNCCPNGRTCCGNEGACCDPCQCQTCSNGNCVSTCDENQACCNGTCYDPATQKCCGGSVHEKCNCMGCVNDAWVSTCNSNLCQDCNTTTGNCQVCGGDPNKFCCDGQCCDKTKCEWCYGYPCQVCPPEIYGENYKCCNGQCMPKCETHEFAEPTYCEGSGEPYECGNSCTTLWSECGPVATTRVYEGFRAKYCNGGCPGECPDPCERVCFTIYNCVKRLSGMVYNHTCDFGTGSCFEHEQEGATCFMCEKATSGMPFYVDHSECTE